jgi:ABC-type glycerol-3-phosphate transport system permease component
VLILGVLVSLFLFYWMVVMATNATENIIKLPPALTPGGEPLVVLVDPDQEMRRSAPLHTRHGPRRTDRLPRWRTQFRRESRKGCRTRLICDTKNGFVFSE